MLGREAPLWEEGGAGECGERARCELRGASKRTNLSWRAKDWRVKNLLKSTQAVEQGSLIFLSVILEEVRFSKGRARSGNSITRRIISKMCAQPAMRRRCSSS